MKDHEDEILLVEDDPDIREDLAALLSEEGYRVHQASNGRDALRLLDVLRPCIILLDLMMPIMNGWDFRAKQLEDPRVKDIPVVVLSGAAQARAEAERLSATAFLQKPFDLLPLLEVIERYC